jgi:hypothetical protein
MTNFEVPKDHPSWKEVNFNTGHDVLGDRLQDELKGKLLLFPGAEQQFGEDTEPLRYLILSGNGNGI